MTLGAELEEGAGDAAITSTSIRTRRWSDEGNSANGDSASSGAGQNIPACFISSV